MEIKIRKAFNLKDYNSIKDLAQIIWTEYYTPLIGSDQLVYMLEKFQTVSAIQNQIKNGYEYYLVCLDDRIISYFSIKNQTISIFLSKIYVLKAYRGKGVGKVALNFINRLAKHLSINEVNLTVNKNNVDAIQAYEKLGFKNTESLVIDIGEGFVMDDYRMVKLL